MSDTSARAKPISRVAFIAPDATTLLYEYNALAAAIRKKGDQVRCFSPNISREDAAQLDLQGIHCTQFSLAPEGFALFPQRRAIADLSRLLDEWKPTHVVAIGGLEIVHAIRAARKITPNHIIAIPETLPAQRQNDLSDQDDSHPQPRPFKKALKAASAVVCLNNSAPTTLLNQKLIDEDTIVVVTPRCGVDLETYDDTPLPPWRDAIVIHLSAPLEDGHGILAYCEAAALIKKETPSTQFILSGPPGQTEHPIPMEELEPYIEAVEYVGSRLAPKDDLASCHVFICLSRNETIPLVAMRALALGRPVIAANSPENREFIDERVNGCLVNPSNISEIAAAIRSFLRRPDLTPAMARASRQKAVRRLDQRTATAKLLPLLEL